jgi:hypothetical protein
MQTMFDFIWRKNRGTITGHKTQSRFRPRLEALEDRYLLSGGVLDPTFGSCGIVTTAVQSSSGANAVATYPDAGTANDGKMVVVGESAAVGSNSKNQITVVRYNLSGALDTSFGGAGEVITNLKNGGMAQDVAIG